MDSSILKFPVCAVGLIFLLSLWYEQKLRASMGFSTTDNQISDLKTIARVYELFPCPISYGKGFFFLIKDYSPLVLKTVF